MMKFAAFLFGFVIPAKAGIHALRLAHPALPNPTKRKDVDPGLRRDDETGNRQVPFFSRISLSVILMLLALPAWAYPQVQRIPTDLGVEIWLMEDHTLPITAWELTFRGAGQVTDGTQAGRAAFASSTVTEGSGELDSFAFHALLEERAIQLSVGSDSDDFSASITSLHGDREEAFKRLALTLTQPKLAEASLAEARQQFAAARLRKLQQPMAQAVDQFWQQAYKTHPYAQDGLGTEASIKALTAADIQQYLQENITRDRLILSVAGDISAGEAKRLVETHLQALPAKAKTPAKIATAPTWPAGQHYRHIMPTDQSALWLALPAVNRTHPDFYAIYTLNHILGGSGFASELMQEVRIRQSLVYGVGTGLAQRDASALLIGTLQTRPGNEDKALKAVAQVMTKLSSGEITEVMRSKAISNIVGHLPLQMDTVGKLAAFLTLMQREKLGADYLDKRAAAFQSVTLNDLKRVAKTYLDPKKLVISQASPK